MNYSIKAKSISQNDGTISIKKTAITFGTTPESAEELANPVELLLGSFAACMLKNVERFSGFMKFEYTRAELGVEAIRLDKPPKVDNIIFDLKVYSQDDKLNINLLKKNIEKFSTVYNTLKPSCSISGEVQQVRV